MVHRGRQQKAFKGEEIRFRGSAHAHFHRANGNSTRSQRVLLKLDNNQDKVDNCASVFQCRGKNGPAGTRCHAVPCGVGTAGSAPSVTVAPLGVGVGCWPAMRPGLKPEANSSLHPRRDPPRAAQHRRMAHTDGPSFFFTSCCCVLVGLRRRSVRSKRGSGQC